MNDMTAGKKKNFLCSSFETFETKVKTHQVLLSNTFM